MIDFKKLCPYLCQEEIDKLNEIRNKPYFHGAIVNLSLVDPSVLVEKYGVEIDEHDSYLIRFNSPLGKTLEHVSGAFYIMDPSASLVSLFLKPIENEIVLDLCASPGGKTISYAIKNPNSLIIANEISFSRTNILRQNVERMGLSNVIITNHNIDYFVQHCPKFFDKIILDVPCSGSGMYRKEKEVEEDFSFEKIDRLLPIQKELLDKSVSILKDGGVISYSTCSFSQLEDEEQVLSFLDSHKEFSLVDLPTQEGFLKTKGPGIYLLPTHFKGEGQYICLLKHNGNTSNNVKLLEKTFKYKNKEYYLSTYSEKIKYIDSLVPGVLINNEKEKSFYSHAYARAYKKFENKIYLDNEEKALDFLHGDELNIDSKYSGEYLICYQNLQLGFGKANNGRLKNYLPKGVRLQSR